MITGEAVITEGRRGEVPRPMSPVPPHAILRDHGLALVPEVHSVITLEDYRDQGSCLITENWARLCQPLELP